MQNLIVRVTEFQNLHYPIPEGQAISIDYEVAFNWLAGPLSFDFLLYFSIFLNIIQFPFISPPFPLFKR